MPRPSLLLVAILAIFASTARGQSKLPQTHDYQKTLRTYLASLKESDLAVPILQPLPLPKVIGTELAYRAWVLTSGGYIPPTFADVRAPAEQFTLKWLEGGVDVLRPPVNPCFYSWLVQWNYPINPYRDHQALKRRAFVVLAVDLMMHDQLHEADPKGFNARSDFLGGTLIWLGYDYHICKDVLPADVRAAYETGLKKMVKRLNEWGPRRSMADMDLFAPVGLHYSALATGDKETKDIAATYSRDLMQDRKLFHPAGFFVDAGSFDASYNGISLYFTTWGATLTGSPLMRDALARSYRLKSHLMLPEPDGRIVGPTHFNPRTSGDSAADQWNWRYRDCAAAMLVDDALACAQPPTKEELAAAPARLLSAFASAVADKTNLPVTKPTPWAERHWTMQPNFGEMYYQDGFVERYRKLEADKSPLVVLPFRRPQSFVQQFDDHFVIARHKGFGVVIHTGPVSDDDKKSQRPRGYGGGALSAFWTPETGSVVLGRRRGIQGPVWDKLDEWRTQPTHAVSLLTSEGKVTTSARILKPGVTTKVTADSADIVVAGALPDSHVEQGKVLVGKIDYQRRFEIADAGLKVRTTLKSDGKDKLREAYEIVPLYHKDARASAKKEAFRVLYLAKDGWQPLPSDRTVPAAKIRVERFAGAIEIELDRPRPVKLADEWIDGYMSAATCRNVLIDLLDSGDRTFDALEVSYRLLPVAK